MSDPTAGNGLPTEDAPGDLTTYDATPDVDDDDVIDISDNSGPELTSGVADVDPGSAGGAVPDDEP